MSHKDKQFSYATLFKSTFKLSMFTFGGGYVIVPLMRKRFVDELGWIDQDDMIDMISIAQAAPGVMATNVSIILGYKLSGFKGALVATFGTILPPFIIISIITFFYQSLQDNVIINQMLQGMSAGIAAMILDTSISFITDLLKVNKIFNTIMFILAFTLTYIFKINVAYIVFSSILVGIIYTLIMKGRKKYVA
ncbi:MAG: chromate transporter [Bacilli bacterium]